MPPVGDDATTDAERVAANRRMRDERVPRCGEFSTVDEFRAGRLRLVAPFGVEGLGDGAGLTVPFVDAGRP